MPRPRYTDKFDNPLYDRYDDLAGDYDDPLDGFSVISLDDPEAYDDDDLDS